MRVVLLDAEYEVRRFPLATESAVIMLPVVNRGLLDRAVRVLKARGLRSIDLVTRRDPRTDFDIARCAQEHGLRVHGTAGEAIACAWNGRTIDEPVLLLQANLDPLPDLTEIVKAHATGKQQLTWVRGHAVFGPGQYAFGPPIAAMIGPWLARILAGRADDRPLAALPKIARERGVAAQSVDCGTVVEINNAFALHQANVGSADLKPYNLRARGYRRLGELLWAHEEAEIGRAHVDPSGGPVVVGWGAQVEDGVLLRGPTIVGDGVTIERGSCVHRSVLLASTWLGRESFVANSVVSPLLVERVA
jgi:hypothetical protein